MNANASMTMDDLKRAVSNGDVDVEGLWDVHEKEHASIAFYMDRLRRRIRENQNTLDILIKAHGHIHVNEFAYDIPVLIQVQIVRTRILAYQCALEDAKSEFGDLTAERPSKAPTEDDVAARIDPQSLSPRSHVTPSLLDRALGAVSVGKTG